MNKVNNNSVEMPQQTISELQKEISAFTVLIKDYNITFSDLTNSSPDKPEILQNAKRLAEIINTNNNLKTSFLEKKKLPIKQLRNLDSSSKVILSKYNKYVTALTLIYSGKFTLLHEYISR
ncbi:hypothetical protein AM500_13515 [Bacillus sp. FJAT-18017]|uniref:hypothetical protein n=1 Tax=Bacillus sp. FJAT-18017 TaxID=1705566 RepID=UPI0006AFFD92|nr:hypothetical protein [Bacillus sp. FJAT-18017]ALC90688.1 hypothetical protein AM500_13515 [Bacillus sp. FJAT-18017]